MPKSKAKPEPLVTVPGGNPFDLDQQLYLRFRIDQDSPVTQH